MKVKVMVKEWLNADGYLKLEAVEILSKLESRGIADALTGR
jgi:hypothetical protein